jgi:hypothetical protein
MPFYRLGKNPLKTGPITGRKLNTPNPALVPSSLTISTGPVSPSGESKGFNHPMNPVVKKTPIASQFSTIKIKPKIKAIKDTIVIKVTIGLTNPPRREDEPPEFD